MNLEGRIERIPIAGCWIWMGSLRPSGYGRYGKGGKLRAHRVVYEFFKGPIPLGFHVLHICDVPCCVNPAHLKLGTHTDNMRDMVQKGRHRTLRGPKHYNFGKHHSNSTKQKLKLAWERRREKNSGV